MPTIKIILDEAQSRAVEEVTKWYKLHKTQRFVLAGYAGTGKTTIVPVILESLSLDDDSVAFCAYTGKAAMVLRQKGIKGASTIHSLIYDVEKVKTEDGGWEIHFVRKDELDYSLIVVDEASMVGKEIQQDLESYGIPVLYVGDHGQLPPVGDSFSNLMSFPDFKLETIHRQAMDNPILRMATLARSGNISSIRSIPNDDRFRRVPKSNMTFQNLLGFDQVLCGRNTTRQKINNSIRHYFELDKDLGKIPTVGDRVICLQNDLRQSGLINGMTGTVEAIKPLADGNALMSFQDEDGDFYQHYDKLGHRREVGLKLSNPVSPDETIPAVRIQLNAFLGEEINRENRRHIPFDFSYAITVHKSQGSQYNNIAIVEEHLGPGAKLHSRWLYTAITRGIESVTIFS